MAFPPALIQIVSYFVVGGIGLTTNLGTFYILLRFVRAEYLVASTLAFSVAAVVGFILQKIWTFRGRAQFATWMQFILYIAVAVLNLGVNDALVYILVGGVHLMPLMAQTAGAAVVAVLSFLIYKHGIFRASGTESYPSL